MPTTTDVLEEHLGGGQTLASVQVKLIEEELTLTDKTEVVATVSWSWADIQDDLSGEWEIGGSAAATDAIRGPGRIKTSEAI